MTIRENVALAPLTTLQVGGPARYFAEAHREEEVREAVNFAKTRNLPLFVLGGGSNLVVSDSGWPGLVLHIAIGGLSNESSGNAVLFTVGAGYDWDGFVTQAVAQNCAGVECLSGIPGSVGGTPVQNVGAYGQEVAETIESVRALDTRTEGRIVTLPRPACGFRYRSSIFNNEERGRYIILRVHYRLRRSDTPTLKYADLQKHFSESKTPPSLSAIREAVLQSAELKACSSSRETAIRAALVPSSRTPCSRHRSSKTSALAQPRRVWKSPAIQLSTPGTRFPRPGWSSTPDSAKDSGSVRLVFQPNTLSR